MRSTVVPSNLIIQAHPLDGSLFSLVVHLRVEFRTGRQCSTGYMTLSEIKNALDHWARDRQDFLLHHFGWSADAIDAQIAAHGDIKERVRRPGAGGLTLADLGL